MRVFIFSLLSVVITRAANPNCSFLIDNSSYERNILARTNGLPTNLAYNPNTKELFYTLIDMNSLQNDDEQTKMDNYVLKDGVGYKMENISGQTTAIDVKRNKVYFGTESGLYEYDKDTMSTTYLGLQEHDIVHLYKPAHTDEIYAIFFPNHDVYIINANGTVFRRVDEVPCAYILAVDKHDNIYYECEAKYIKVLLNGFRESVQFIGFPKDYGKAVTIDDTNRVLFATSDGVYHLRPDNVIPRKIMELDFIPSGLFAHDNDYYVAANNVIYKYSNTYC